ncbi:MAG: M23 family metallopeptidase [Bacteroidetes bacterium]|nr:M23 family metallopeptidase [Bacteroidota bacterium]
MRLLAGLLGTVLLAAACEPLPEASLRQFDLSVSSAFEADTLLLTVRNPAPVPMRMVVSSRDAEVDARIARRFDMPGASDSTLMINIAGLDSSRVRSAVSLSYTMGSLATPVRPGVLSWPFPAGRTYEIIQGYGGSFSHQSAYSRHALDFRLAVADTISAADGGVVVGVIEGYDVGGNDPKYRPYANFITLYHPHTGLLTQYVHLVPDGSFVAVGDTVARGEPIGLAGLTGFTNTQHLHFNVLVPDSAEGMVSFPAVFADSMAGSTLKRGDRVFH